MKKKNLTIIAEIGVNHNGSMNVAKKLVKQAAKAGADYVKFQSFKAENLATKNSTAAEYQTKFLGKKYTQYSMLKKYELSFKNHLELIKECGKHKIKFLSSPFDLESIKLLIRLKLKTIKIPSGEINNVPYLRYLGRFNKNIILSTGMSNLKEINQAIKILKLSGTAKKKISILHCTSEYPTSFQNTNLDVIKNLKQKLKCKIGYSDHTIGSLASICAVNQGAEIIEKHITISNSMLGPDHKSSLRVSKLSDFIKKIRSINTLLGNSKKKPTIGEKKNSLHIRKSIFAKTKIARGDLLSSKNLITLRPGKYLSASNWDKVINKRSKFDFLPGDPIKLR
tara:strand:- start:481 stop:1494 length:1014 start_codon:yes stop_codon:yes gene_type:complete